MHELQTSHGRINSSFAKGSNCSDVAVPIAQQKIPLSSCVCDKTIHDLPINEHPDLPLVAVCNYAKDEWVQTGDYFFKGNLLVSGEVTREKTETFGDTIRFYVEGKEAELLFNGSGPDLRFQNEKLFVSAVRAPKLTKNARCLSAKASLRIKSLHTLADPGTDFDGMYVLQYKIVRVGNFKKCKPNVSTQ